MKESEVCTKIKNSINAAGHWAFKIPDSIKVPGRTQFSRPKGFDIVAGISGALVAIEVKLVKTMPKAFKTFEKLFTPSQIKELTALTETRSGHAFAFICVYKNARKAEDRTHELYVLRWRHLEFDFWRVHNDIRNGGIKPLEYSKGRYDLDSFMKTFRRC